MTPWDVALRMMRNGRDPGLVVAYLAEEARRADVDPIDLSELPFDRRVREITRAFVSINLNPEPWQEFQLAAAVGARRAGKTAVLKRAAERARAAGATVHVAGPP